jgi:hypothetical protein
MTPKRHPNYYPSSVCLTTAATASNYAFLVHGASGSSAEAGCEDLGAQGSGEAAGEARAPLGESSEQSGRPC